MAIHNKKNTVDQAKQLLERSKGMYEFVVKIDMNLDAPYLCSGAVINIDRGGIPVPVIIVNQKEYSSFFTIDQLELIRDALIRNDASTSSDIGKVCPTAVASGVFEGVTINMLMDPNSGSQLMSMYMFAAFMTGSASRLRGSKVDIRNLAARTHVYFNTLPAGSGAGTNIKMVSSNQIPHAIDYINPSSVLQLVCLNESTKDITVSMRNPDGSTNKLVVEPDIVSFTDPDVNDKSMTAASFFDMIVLFEKIRSDSDAAKKQHESEIATLKAKIKGLKKKK
jgi:hypothetical protein